VSRKLHLLFALAVLGFWATLLLAARGLGGVDDAALTIAGVSAPAIQSLAEGRTELRRLQVVAREYADDRALNAARGPEALRASRRALDESISRYLALPVKERDEDLWRAVQDNLGALDVTTRALVGAVGAGDLAVARRIEDTELRDDAERLSSSLNAVLETHAGRARRLAIAIRASHALASRTALGLGIGSTVLAMIASFAAAALVGRRTREIEARSQELEAFAARVAHDVLGPINAVSLALDAVERRPETAARSLPRARRAVLHVGRVVHGLLDFARAGGRPRPGQRTDAVSISSDVVADLEDEAAAARCTLAREVEGPLTVACSPGVLSSVLDNLLRNAVKYMGDSPVRHISLRAGASRPGFARFEVEDTGPGLPPDARSLFEPYVRGPNADQPGLGLGLATVKRLVDGHGGCVGAIALPRGARFWFELPVGR
jgi:signal transduction histidine kinase